jgi:hypothetical protein
VDENERHRTAKELFKRAEEISSLIRRIDETLKLPNLTEAQTRDIELIPQRIGSSIRAIREATIAEGTRVLRDQQLVASTERLRQEIAIANEILDELLKALAGRRERAETRPRTGWLTVAKRVLRLRIG